MVIPSRLAILKRDLLLMSLFPHLVSFVLFAGIKSYRGKLVHFTLTIAVTLYYEN